MCGVLEFDWKYGEGDVLSELAEYLKGTYGAHYTNENNDVQTLDVFASRGTLASTSIDNAIKYLMRYGKKNGKNVETKFVVPRHREPAPGPGV